MVVVESIAVVETACYFHQKNPRYNYFVRRCFALLSETSGSSAPPCLAYLADYTAAAAFAVVAAAFAVVAAVAALGTYPASTRVDQIKQSIVHIVVAEPDQFEPVASQTQSYMQLVERKHHYLDLYFLHFF